MLKRKKSRSEREDRRRCRRRLFVSGLRSSSSSSSTVAESQTRVQNPLWIPSRNLAERRLNKRERVQPGKIEGSFRGLPPLITNRRPAPGLRRALPCPRSTYWRDRPADWGVTGPAVRAGWWAAKYLVQVAEGYWKRATTALEDFLSPVQANTGPADVGGTQEEGLWGSGSHRRAEMKQCSTNCCRPF